MTDPEKPASEEPSAEEVTPEVEAPAPAEPAAEPAAPAIDAQEVNEGKSFAVLCYVLSLIGLPFFIVPLIMRNNEFSLYHAKQNLMIWIVGLVGGVAGSILSMVCIGFIVLLALAVFWYIWLIMGLIAASKGQIKPAIMIGKWGEDWFKGITKA